MPTSQVDLVNLFQTVTQALRENQASLNEADELNQNHGSNMVNTFQTITKSVKAQKKKGASDSTALAYAANQLAKKSTSSSGQLYARNLSAASTQFKGKKVDQRGAMDLLMTLIGGGAAAQTTSQPAAPASGGNNLLGGLVGSLMGGGTTQQTSQQQSSGGGDLLSTLLGEVLGGGSTQQTSQQTSQGDGQIGLDDILQAVGAFMQAKQSGQSGLQALMSAFMAASRMGDTVHRQQSTQMVVNSFLGALTQAGGK